MRRVCVDMWRGSIVCITLARTYNLLINQLYFVVTKCMAPDKIFACYFTSAWKGYQILTFWSLFIIRLFVFTLFARGCWHPGSFSSSARCEMVKESSTLYEDGCTRNACVPTIRVCEARQNTRCKNALWTLMVMYWWYSVTCRQVFILVVGSWWW